MSLVFLTGMPGAGKTTLGRAWAQQHGWGFIDIDEEIEQFTGVAIHQVFDSVGEDGFRAIETHMLEQAITGSSRLNTVIATGGGTPCFGDNLAQMQAAGCVVYLKARLKTLMSHLAGAKAVRPLLSELSIESLEALQDARSAFYEQATIIIPVEKAGEGTFAQIIEACTNRPL